MSMTKVRLRLYSWKAAAEHGDYDLVRSVTLTESKRRFIEGMRCSISEHCCCGD